MTQKQGNISIHAQNIMPIIKKWLYSDKDIFLRELVSNGSDAISKHQLLVQRAETEATNEPYAIHVEVDEARKILRFMDNGLGMTAEEVEKFINQVAFSGAEEFAEKYKDQGESGQIIGHFGLGFYSSFMVAEKVVIDTKSYTGAPAARWESEDGMAFSLFEGERQTRGTTITLHIAPDEEEFLKTWRVREVLEKYCGYMPLPIYIDEIKVEADTAEKKDGEEDTLPAEPKPINDTNPLWNTPAREITDDQYKDFYRKAFREYEEPLFWIHLNVDYPFNLKGILYFPKLKQEVGGNEGQIKMYCSQVFVADNVKEVIPEFLLLLKGVIDCPDLPLNVSRSFLQNDGYVKKLSDHITKKVADKLVSLFENQRELYDGYWKDLHVFIKYGCMRDAKFFERVGDILLFEDTKGTLHALPQLKEMAKEGDKTLHYTQDAARQAGLLQMLDAQGKMVFKLDHLIDTNFISFLEYSQQELKFARVDADGELFAPKDEDDKTTDETTRATLETFMRKVSGDEHLVVKLQAMQGEGLHGVMMLDEQMRRMQEMSKMYGQGFSLPATQTLLLNQNSALVRFLLDHAQEDNEIALLAAQQVVDLAQLLVQPLEGERMAQFLTRSGKIAELLVK